MPKIPDELHGLLTEPDEPRPNPALAAALEWAEKGWPVFPLKPHGKIPAIPSAHKGEKGPKCDGRCGRFGHGVLDASTDPEVIRRLFASHPNANIGGAATGRVIFDFDRQHGAETADAFPTTREHLSGRGNGNAHWVYRVGGDLARLIKPGAHVLGQGVDIRATHGSYVVLPPSLHPDTLKPYTVTDETVPEHVLTDDDVRAIFAAYGEPAPGERKAPDAPAERPSLDLGAAGGLFAQSEAMQALLNPPTRGTGETNVALARVAGYYARLFRDSRELYDHHIDQWLATVDPGYEDKAKTVDSIWNTEHSKEGERARRVEERVESKLIEHEAKALFTRALAELEPAEPFDVGSLAEILARPDTERFRVEGLLLSEGFTTVVAARKTGKTTFNLNLADSLLSGRDFLGRFPVEPVEGRIALLNYEVAAKQVAHWASLVGVDPERFDIVTLRGRRNPLLHPQDRADLAEYLRGREVELLFVDPFSRAFYGESQQDNTQVQAFLSDLDVFARSEVGARDVVLNVHAGWNADRSRGASALEDHPDSIIWLKPGDREKGDRSTYIEAKGRDVDVEEMQLAFDPATYRLSLTGEGSRREVKLMQKQGDLEPAILRIVAAEPGINTKGITENLRTARVPFQKGDETKTLKAMLDGGRIGWQKGERNASRWYPAGHPDAVTKAPLTGIGEVGF